MTETPHDQDAGLLLDSVTLALNGKSLLTIDSLIKPGEILTIMGESGSGKSSLLDFVAGFLRPDFSASGRIILHGRDLTRLPPQQRQIGLMFQSPLLFPHMSVLQNLLYALPAEVKGGKHRQELAEAALRDVGLDGFGGRDPATLSGGQQTRVALMRTLLADPKALLLDEPFSSLDKMRRSDIRQLVFKIARQRELPVLLVTHDMEDAAAADGPVFTLDR
ncbi:ATP-binding cassette domain-containing protein [Roseibium denhamense]|uniref:Thiamine transport system ATP-binding protein n=1 Tax=Roseibium denhamense TaxID=76305 RepID=A0ABY1P1A0_9HYPH|nr:ATP-binding cassette domain-containing protein [Roseibium denhamense]MTI05122.1 ATP-binding cassette domain-containing protein [Roseibium denhamense]SMP22760.1 putative thiamine transport system ATP-binding protein [Roseibium denhamense]